MWIRFVNTKTQEVFIDAIDADQYFVNDSGDVVEVVENAGVEEVIRRPDMIAEIQYDGEYVRIN